MTSPRPLLERCLLAVCLLLAACSSSDRLPRELFGHWTTEDPRYEGRYFQVERRGVVLFGQGAGKAHGGRVISVERTPLGTGGERCELVYTDGEGIDYDLSVELAPDGKSLVFSESRRVRWVRKEGPR